VVGNTFTAFALSRTWLIGAGAFGFIDFNLAFHLQFSPPDELLEKIERGEVDK